MPTRLNAELSDGLLKCNGFKIHIMEAAEQAVGDMSRCTTPDLWRRIDICDIRLLIKPVQLEIWKQEIAKRFSFKKIVIEDLG